MKNVAPNFYLSRSFIRKLMKHLLIVSIAMTLEIFSSDSLSDANFYFVIVNKTYSVAKLKAMIDLNFFYIFYKFILL